MFLSLEGEGGAYRQAGVLPIGEGEVPVGLLTTSEVGGFDAAMVKGQIVAALGLWRGLHSR